MIPQRTEKAPQRTEMVMQPTEMAPQRTEMIKQHCGTISADDHSNITHHFTKFTIKIMF
ncbi:hypothetical protein [Chryseobacterium sp. VAUSW3]|uniref:hypothetical protein n=1 Tax=Chryseobacterium sp. VAUSW3 TaxID=2010998 RepID=UPI001E4AEC65|nr:hypothetical protein [Chryseobacterium sp. VAUSW3]